MISFTMLRTPQKGVSNLTKSILEFSMQSILEFQIDVSPVTSDHSSDLRTKVNAGYDYAAFDEDVRQTLRASAISIRSHCDSIRSSFFEIGKKLADAKALLPHGEFQHWLNAEFQWSVRMAGYYMTAYNWSQGLSPSQLEIISDLPLTMLNQLAAPATSEDVKRAFFDKSEAGEKLGPDDLKNLINGSRVKLKPKFGAIAPEVSDITTHSAVPIQLFPQHSPTKPSIIDAGLRPNDTQSLPEWTASFVTWLKLTLQDDELLMSIADKLTTTEGINCFRLELKGIRKREQLRDAA